MKSYNTQLHGKKCKGCGAFLHNIEGEIGYTPKDILTINLCQGCYQLKHYGKSSGETKNDHQPVNELFLQDWSAPTAWLDLKAKIQKANVLTVLVTDIYNFSVLEQLDSWPLTAHTLICINKKDLVNFDILQSVMGFWEQKLSRCKIKFQIILISAKTRENFSKLLHYVGQFKTVCFLGHSGVGKSFIVNTLAKKYKTNVENIVGKYLNTTKNIIASKFKGVKILDTPGSVRNRGIFGLLSPSQIKGLQKAPWKQKIFQTCSDRTYHLENFVIVHIANDPNDDYKYRRKSLIFYGPGNVKIIHNKLIPDLNDLKFYSELQSYHSQVEWVEYKYSVHGALKLCVDDLGWIHITTPNRTNLTIFLPKHVKITDFCLLAR